jgi:hypothetical protein
MHHKQQQQRFVFNRRKMDRALKDARVDYEAKSTALADVQKYNADQIELIESKVAEKAALTARLQSREMELKIQRLEQQAVTLVKQKDDAIAELKTQNHQLAVQCKHETEQRRTIHEATQHLRVQVSDLRAELIASHAETRKVQEESAAQLRSVKQSKTQLLETIQSQVHEHSQLQSELRKRNQTCEAQLVAAQAQLSTHAADTSKQHQAELDSISLRVKQLMGKKDEQIIALKRQVQEFEHALAGMIA